MAINFDITLSNLDTIATLAEKLKGKIMGLDLADDVAIKEAGIDEGVQDIVDQANALESEFWTDMEGVT